MRRLTTRFRTLWPFLLVMFAIPTVAETWYVRPDGGSRYSAKVHTGQCDGRADAAYSGNGSNRHCAFNEVRYLWDDGSYGNYAWVISGGDTVVIRGCSAASDQGNPDNPHCRIGWDTGSGPGSRGWCAGSQSNDSCSNPPIPAGTPSQHTRILGQCVLTNTCNAGNMTNRVNLTQLFGGFGVGTVLNLTDTHWVDIEGLEITAHNGACSRVGAPPDPRGCNKFPPSADDYDIQGVSTNNATANVTFQDIYVHGHGSNGFFGAIGGPIKMNRVFIGFNAFAGWNFDDGRSTPDAPGSSISADYVTMIGNGCNEEYPIVHKEFPARACYDSDSGGFGDSWSGQDTKLESFTCNHCVMAYNTKDGFIGPHTAIAHLTITNSESYGNMGQQWKWGTDPKSTLVFQNNLTIGNCRRMSAPLPGSSPGYNRHLDLFCRAAGDVFSFYTAPNSTVLFTNNTTIGYSATIFDLSCQKTNSCGSTQFIFRNNIVLGFFNASYNPGEPKVPGLFYFSDSSVRLTSDHNVLYNFRSNPCPLFGRPDLICSDPLFIQEPPLKLTSESQLDRFNFHPRHGSPAIGHGQAIPGLNTDFFGASRTTPASIGAVEPEK